MFKMSVALFTLLVQIGQPVWAQKKIETRTVVAVEPVEFEVSGSAFECTPGTGSPQFDTNMTTKVYVGSNHFLGNLRNAETLRFEGPINGECNDIKRDIISQTWARFKLSGLRTVTLVKRYTDCTESVEERIVAKLEGTEMSFASFNPFVIRKLKPTECK